MATWDGTNAFKAMTLSGGNAVATSTGSSIDSCRSTDSKSTGKWYVKLTATTVHTSQPYFWILGLQAAGYDPNTASNVQGYENTTNSLGVNASGQIVFLGGFSSETFVAPLASGDTVEVAIDIDNALLWRRRNAEVWNSGIPSADPATGVGGVDLTTPLGGSALAAAPWYFGFASAVDSGDVATITTGTPPSGFTDWNAGGGGGGGVTWNPSDKDAGITLSNADLTATRA